MHPSEMTQQDIEDMIEASSRRIESYREFDAFMSGDTELQISFSDSQIAMITTVPVTAFD
jgi:hypothetical protein